MGQLDAQLFMALARIAEQRVSEFNAQDLANTAWAFAKVGQLDASLFAALGRAAECRVGDFNGQGLRMTLWALSWRESLKDGWSLFDLGKCIAVCFGLPLFEALLMECEQRGLTCYLKIWRDWKAQQATTAPKWASEQLRSV